MRSSGWSLDPIRVRVWKRPESSSSLTTYTHEGKAMRAPGERASHEEGLSVATESAGTLILDFQLPELWGNWFLLFKPPALWCFITVAKAVFGKYSRWSECRLGYLLQGAKPWRSWDFFFSSNVGSVAAPQSLCWKTLAGMRLPSTGLAYACAGWRGCLCWWTWRQAGHWWQVSLTQGKGRGCCQAVVLVVTSGRCSGSSLLRQHHGTPVSWSYVLGNPGSAESTVPGIGRSWDKNRTNFLLCTNLKIAILIFALDVQN